MRLRKADGTNWMIGGETDSPDFPSTSGSPVANGKNLWIGRIASDFSTAPTLRLFGGTGDEHFGGLAAIPGRGLYLAGTTTSTDLPAAGNTFGGGASDGFVAALDPLTAAPTASNYIGGSGRDEIHAMETDGYDLMLGGDTDSSDLVLPGLAAGQNVLGGLDALFVLSDAYAATRNSKPVMYPTHPALPTVPKHFPSAAPVWSVARRPPSLPAVSIAAPAFPPAVRPSA